MNVKAKFMINSVAENAGGTKVVKMNAISKADGDKEDYSKYTPAGQIELHISQETKAYYFFKPGQCVTVLFEESEK